MNSASGWVRGLVLAWILLTALIAGCGGGGGGSDSGPVNVSITSQPSDVAVVEGSAALFQVTATGDVSGYQWQVSTDGGVNWGSVSGATTADYSLTAVAASLSGNRYRVQVSGTGGPVFSSAVTLTVTAPTPASISVQPVSQAVTAGQNASFSVTASGTSLQYQWQSSSDGSTWSAVSGANSATLTLSSVALSNTGTSYRVVVSNSLNSVTSDAAALTVNAAPVSVQVTTQPSAVSVTAPATATFTVVAVGTPSPTYQWQRSTNGGASFSDISGATASSYTTPATTVSDSGGQYRVVVSNTTPSTATSQAVVLTVAPTPVAPTFTTQPAAVSVTAPAGATFTASAAGTPTPTYQWQVSTDGGTTYSNINSATGASYSLSSTTVVNNGQRYRVVATNSAGSATSNAAILSVASAPSTVALHRLSTTTGFSLAVKADGSVLAWGTRMSGGSGTAVSGSAATRVGGISAAAAAYAYADEAGVIANQSLVVQSSGAVSGWGSGSLLGLGLGVFVDGVTGLQLVSASPINISQLTGIKDIRMLPNGTAVALSTSGSVWLLAGKVNQVLTGGGSVEALQVTGLGSVLSLGDPIAESPTTASWTSRIPVVDSSGAAKMITVKVAMASGAVASGASLIYTSIYSVESISGLPVVSKVACSGTFIQYHCLALSDDKTVWSWGTVGIHGEMGDGTEVAKTIPFQVSGLTGIKDVAATHFGSFALTESGTVYSWGRVSEIGRNPIGETTTGLGDPVPSTVAALSGVVEISASGPDPSGMGIRQRVLVRLSDGSVWGWGDNNSGELGDGTTAFALTPVRAVGINLN